MPTYTYICQYCQHTVELYDRAFGDVRREPCSKCGDVMKQQFPMPALRFYASPSDFGINDKPHPATQQDVPKGVSPEAMGFLP